jgi:ferredoxin
MDKTTVNDITPQKALELSREGFDWRGYVQTRLNETIPDAARATGARSCTVEFACTNDVPLSTCTTKVLHELKCLGWGTGDVTTVQPSNDGIQVVVYW